MKKLDRKTIITLIVFILIIVGIVIYMRMRKPKDILERAGGEPSGEGDEGELVISPPYGAPSPPQKVAVRAVPDRDASIVYYAEPYDSKKKRKGWIKLRLNSVVPNLRGKYIFIHGAKKSGYNKCVLVVGQADGNDYSVLFVPMPIQNVTTTWRNAQNVPAKIDQASKGYIDFGCPKRKTFIR